MEWIVEQRLMNHNHATFFLVDLFSLNVTPGKTIRSALRSILTDENFSFKLA